MNKKTVSRIAAVACALASVMALTACVSTPKQGDTIPSGKIIVVGRLDPGLKLTEFFGVKNEEALGLRVAFNSEPPETASAATAVLSYSPDDDYFTFVIPSRPTLYLREFTYVPDVSFADQLQLIFDFKRLAVTLPSGAQLVYIGDIRVGYDKNDDPKFAVDDGYEKALAHFKEYFKDSKGGYALPVKALAKGSNEIEATRLTHRVYVRRVYY